MSQSPMEMMQSIKKELEARLEATEEYRALKAIDAAISQMGGAQISRTMPPLIRHRHRPTAELPPRPITQTDAVALVLEETGVMKTTPELVELARARGAIVGGNDPKTSLASSLSRDQRFMTVRIDGKSYWWLSDRPVPEGSSFPSFVFTDEGVRRIEQD